MSLPTKEENLYQILIQNDFKDNTSNNIQLKQKSYGKYIADNKKIKSL